MTNFSLNTLKIEQVWLLTGGVLLSEFGFISLQQV